MLTLAEAADLIGAELHRAEGQANEAIKAITHDSRAISHGAVFACVVGQNLDGHSFATKAKDAGALGLLVERLLDVDLPQLLVADVRASLGSLASAVSGNPSKDLRTIGVTGTAGKTTVVHLLESALEVLGCRARSIGTLTGTRTTPEAPVLQVQLAEMVADEVEAVAIEVSSHALDLGRVSGTHFDVAVFTNLGHDHLDFHKTMEAYGAAKAQLFSKNYTDSAVINTDDRFGAELFAAIQELTAEDPAGPTVHGYSLGDAVELVPDGPTSRFVWNGHPVHLQLAGEHNVLNALAVATTLKVLGHTSYDIAAALTKVSAPVGRFEVLNTDESFYVVVDYAHKPEALVATLGTARQVAGESSRVILVFGCGGDRDQDKRALMGKASAEADFVVITSDNPRTEDPDAIINDIVQAIPADTDYKVVTDRSEAIQMALGRATSGDIVVIAGKGHETYQEIDGNLYEFSDRVVTLELLGGPQ